MKKLTAIILTITLTLTIAACGGNNSSNTSDPTDEERAIGANFKFEKHIGYGDGQFPDQWDYITVDIAREIADVKDDFAHTAVTDSVMTADEIGLTVTWTQGFVPGYSVDDILVFQVVTDYYLIEQSTGYQLISEQESFGFEVYDIMQ